MHTTQKCILAAALVTLATGSAHAQSSETKQRYSDNATTETTTVTEFGKGKLTETLQVKGGSARLVTGADAGYAFSALPGARRITMRELAKLKDIPKTGLYIIDADYIPTSSPSAWRIGASLSLRGTTGP